MKENNLDEEENQIVIRPSILDPNPIPQVKDEWDKKSCCGKCCHYFFAVVVVLNMKEIKIITEKGGKII